MVKMKMSTASDMCTLSCALIVCTLVSTARTINNKDTVVPKFNSTEDESSNDWHSTHSPSKNPSANEMYGSKSTLSTPSMTDPNDYPYLKESVTDNAIDNSTKLENDYMPSDKKNSYTTELTTTTYDTQSLAGPPTRIHALTTTPIMNERYGSTTTPGTPSSTNLNDTMLGDEASVNTTEDVTSNSEKLTNKKYSFTEPITTNGYTHTKLKEPSTRIALTARTTNTTSDDPNISKLNLTETDTFEGWTSTQLPSTTVIAIWKNGSTSTTNGYNLSHKRYSSTESISANDFIWSKPVTMKSKTKWSTGRYPFFLSNTGQPTRYYKPMEWIKPTNKNCTCVFCKHLKNSKNNEEETTTTNIWMQSAESKQWNQQRHMRETTTNNVKGQLEKSQKRKLQQKVLEMESDRTNAILDVFKSHK